jgi:hypothetical protein
MYGEKNYILLNVTEIKENLWVVSLGYMKTKESVREVILKMGSGLCDGGSKHL